MNRMPLLLPVCLLGLLAGCGRSDMPSSPCPTDGRHVAVYFEELPTEKSERIEGKLVGWSGGWVSLRREGLTIHLPVARIRAVHDTGN